MGETGKENDDLQVNWKSTGRKKLISLYKQTAESNDPKQESRKQSTLQVLIFGGSQND